MASSSAIPTLISLVKGFRERLSIAFRSFDHLLSRRSRNVRKSEDHTVQFLPSYLGGLSTSLWWMAGSAPAAGAVAAARLPSSTLNLWAISVMELLTASITSANFSIAFWPSGVGFAWVVGKSSFEGVSWFSGELSPASGSPGVPM